MKARPTQIFIDVVISGTLTAPTLVAVVLAFVVVFLDVVVVKENQGWGMIFPIVGIKLFGSERIEDEGEYRAAPEIRLAGGGERV